MLDTRQWYNSPLGEMIDQQEAELLDELLNGRFGYYAVQINGHRNLLSNARIKRKFVLSNQNDEFCTALAEDTALPIQTDSVDVVVLPHTLEASYDPHQVLREVERILIPEGYILIMGFSPWSLVGLRQLLSFKSSVFPWKNRFYRLSRVLDWLKLLGFESSEVKKYFYGIPAQHPLILRQSGWMGVIGKKCWPFLAGGYLLMAQKRVSTLTPIKPKWRARLVSSEKEVREVSKTGGC